ncbi:hypothetical protein Bca52824_001348 [Brassica carinata]|uniref:Uncharacterized protein n=1 Tax=Brassica carinata TaxID=52824 RepID=A0A8X7WFW4_BRACI|nr:hypothetical protein Bca52824_001348 [Brassica carinata]
MRQEEALTLPWKRKGRFFLVQTTSQVVVLRMSLLYHCKGCGGKVKKHLSRMQGHFDIDYEKKAKLSNLMDVQRIEYSLFYLDYNNDLKRYPRMSAMWCKEFLKKEEIEDSKKEGLMLNSVANKNMNRRGQWKKSAESEWEFVTHPEDICYRVVINETVSYETVDMILRQRYGLGHQTPLVISYRLPSWRLEPHANKIPPTTIFVHGCAGVAEYEFLSRTNFSIGGTSYLFDYTANENSRAAYESLVFGDRAAQTERVMNAIFIEDGIRLFHRVLLEMDFADKFLASQNRTSQPVREIIELDDDDEVMGEVNQATVNHGTSGGANLLVGPESQGAAPPILWDVGIDVGTFPVQPTGQTPNAEGGDDGMAFWAGIANDCVGVGDVTANVTNNESVGMVARQPNEAPENDNPNTLGPCPVGLQGSERSSTGSSNEDIGPLTQPTRNEMTAAEGLVLATTKPLVADNPLGTAANADASIPPMIKLAMFCATKGEGPSNARVRPMETSSEGSSTAGGC